MTGILKRVGPGSFFLIAIIIIMAVFFTTSLGYKDPKVGLMPELMSGITIVLSLFALVGELRKGNKSSAPTDDEGDVIEDEQLLKTPLIAYFQAFGWFAALIVCVYFIGFVAGIPIWMLVYLSKQGYAWWKALAIGVVLTAIIYGVFTTALQIQLYQGVFGQMVLDLLG
jgi:heme A synthase